MADVNDIKAGSYELVADHWDEVTSKPGQPFEFTRHYRGETVRLSQSDARRLLPSGAVRVPGEAELAAAQALQAQLAALIAQVPDELRAQLLGGNTVEEAAEELADQTPADPPVESLTVATAGLANEGDTPRVASASSGEGDGEVQEPGQTAPAPKPAEAAKRSGRS